MIHVEWHIFPTQNKNTEKIEIELKIVPADVPDAPKPSCRDESVLFLLSCVTQQNHKRRPADSHATALARAIHYFFRSPLA